MSLDRNLFQRMLPQRRRRQIFNSFNKGLTVREPGGQLSKKELVSPEPFFGVEDDGGRRPSEYAGMSSYDRLLPTCPLDAKSSRL